MQPQVSPDSLATGDLGKPALPLQQMDGTVHVNDTQVKARTPSYASMVFPNEGTALDFVHVNELNGMEWAKIVEEDIEEEVPYWQNAVTCCVLGANPPLTIIEGYVRRIWKAYAIDKLVLVKRGLYLVRFEVYQDT